MTANRTASSICAKCRPFSRADSTLRPSLRVYLQTCVHFRTGVWTLRTLRVHLRQSDYMSTKLWRTRAHGTPAAYCRRRFVQRSGLSRSTAPNVLLIVASETKNPSYHSTRSTPGQLPDRPDGPGRRDDTSIGHTARPRPIAVADSPIEAATPDPFFGRHIYRSSNCAHNPNRHTTRFTRRGVEPAVTPLTPDPQHPLHMLPIVAPAPVMALYHPRSSGALAASCSQETTARCECRV